MKRRKPGIIKDPKSRGEWGESVFMVRAGEQGLAVSKPWGDSRSYDFVVGRPGRFVSVQVKSTTVESGAVTLAPSENRSREMRVVRLIFSRRRWCEKMSGTFLP